MITSTTAMRILLVTPLFFPSLSGAAVYFDTLSRAIVRHEPTAHVAILTRAVAGAPRLERRGPVRVLRLLPATGAGGTRLGERAAAVLSAIVILLVSLLLRSDVVHYHTLASYRAIHRLAPLFRARLIGDMRDLAAKHEGASLRYYRHCRTLVCASQNILEFIRSQGFPAEKILHVPIPFLPLDRAPAARIAAAVARYGLQTPYVLFVGAITPSKGVRELLEAMEIVWRDSLELRLVLAGPLTPEGEASFPGGFRAFVGGRSLVRYLGPVPHKDVQLLLQGAEVFVLPSHTEGLPRAGLEALALGIRVVLPPGIPEFAAACPEAILKTITPEEIAAKLEFIRRHDTPARYPLERHDPAKIAAAMLALYRAAVRT